MGFRFSWRLFHFYAPWNFLFLWTPSPTGLSISTSHLMENLGRCVPTPTFSAQMTMLLSTHPFPQYKNGIGSSASAQVRMSGAEEANTIPVVDCSAKREDVAQAMVKASEEYGFFKVVNHGVGWDVIREMEEEAMRLFALPQSDKDRGGPTDPYGYGHRTIGCNGDLGWIEYLLLPCHFHHIQQRYKSISPHNYVNFCNIVNKYIGETRKLACRILELLAQGMGLHQNSFSSFLMDTESDSVFRLNHYPPLPRDEASAASESKIGFGEHNDPQILTVIHSNNVGGLQVLLGEGNWVTVSPDPFSFSINVGDCLQAMTNGRLKSVRHRVVVKEEEMKTKGSRLSMMFFGAPAMDAIVRSASLLVDEDHPTLYRPFSWREYKKSIYSFRLGNSLLHRFGVDFPT